MPKFKAPFATLVISLGDANDNGQADLTASLKVGPLSLTSPSVDLGFLDGINFLRGVFEGVGARFAAPKAPRA